MSNRFDVEGYVTGFGNPDWARTHPVATSTAPTVLALLGAGATCVGKTVMDEMAYRFGFFYAHILAHSKTHRDLFCSSKQHLMMRLLSRNLMLNENLLRLFSNIYSILYTCNFYSIHHKT